MRDPSQPAASGKNRTQRPYRSGLSVFFTVRRLGTGAPAKIQPPNHMVSVRSECFGKLRGCHELMTIFNARTAVPARWSTSIEMPSRSFSGRATNFAVVTASAVSTGGRGIARQSRGNGNYRKTVCRTSISALTGRSSPSVSVPYGEVAGNWRFRTTRDIPDPEGSTVRML